jgi:hypothetical protein
MQKQNSVDDFFRRKLADSTVTPSGASREAFLRDAAKETGKRSAKWLWIAGLGTGLLITAGVGIWVFEENSVGKRTETGHENHIKVSENVFTGNTDKNIAIVKKNIEGKGKPIVKEPVRKETKKNRVKNILSQSGSSELPGHQDIAASTAALPGQAKVEANIQPESRAEVPEKSMESIIVPESTEKQAAKPSNTYITPLNQDEQQTRPETRNKEKMPKHHEESSIPRNWNINAGVYYSPEWMFNTLNGDKFVNNMGVEGTFHFGRYSVRTGLGLSITTGSNEILAQTNPFLGSYFVLDSVVFRWNEKRTSLIPTEYTSSANVYDTALNSSYSYMKKRYTYLQVPLVLGYDFWQNNWLSIGMRAGAVMSLLLKTENLSSTYESGKDRIISINNISPDRIQLNWQGIGGINAAFRLSRRYSIELEPDVRYYFNSVYESSSITKKPWSVGIRTAFLITL